MAVNGIIFACKYVVDMMRVSTPLYTAESNSEMVVELGGPFLLGCLFGVAYDYVSSMFESMYLPSIFSSDHSQTSRSVRAAFFGRFLGGDWRTGVGEGLGLQRRFFNRVFLDGESGSSDMWNFNA